MSGNSQVNMTSALIVKKGDAAPSGYTVPPSDASGLEVEADALEPNGRNRETRVPLTADIVRRGREFPMCPAGSSTTPPATGLATAVPNMSAEDVAGYGVRNVTERSYGATEKRFRKLLYAPSSINPVALFSVVFLVGFISFAFALDVSGELIDMIFGSHNRF